MVTHQVYENNLNRFYAAIDKNYDDRTNTKKWCFTLWLATIAFLNNSEQALPFLAAVALSYVPITTFWFLEATQGAYGKILIDKALEMERLQISEWNGIEAPEKYFYLSGRHASVATKARATLHAGLLMETVVTFYILLLVISPALINLMR